MRGKDGKYDVLLIDDNEDFQQLLRVYACKSAIDLITAGSGRQALSLLAARPFNGIVLDYMLPDVDGAAINRALRHDAKLRLNRHTPVIVVSAVEMPAHQLEALYYAGVQLFLPKSFRLIELCLLIKQICFAASARRKFLRKREFAAAHPGQRNRGVAPEACPGFGRTT